MTFWDHILEFPKLKVLELILLIGIILKLCLRSYTVWNKDWSVNSHVYWNALYLDKIWWSSCTSGWKQTWSGFTADWGGSMFNTDRLGMYFSRSEQSTHTIWCLKEYTRHSSTHTFLGQYKRTHTVNPRYMNT